MEHRTVAIFTAVALEAKAVAAALGLACPSPGRSVCGTVAGMSARLDLIGIRAPGLPSQWVGERPRCVVMAGLAGALDPSLRIGDVVIDVGPDDAITVSGCRRGTICTSDRIVATPSQKAELFRTTAASAVDMENAAVREWAGRQGARFIAIRAISDRADQTLDPAVLRLVDQWGRPRPGALLRMLLTRPSILPALLRLGSDSKHAARQLGNAVRDLAEELARQPTPHQATTRLEP